MSFGVRIKELRKENKMTQAELAQKLNVDRSTIGKWESDSSIPGSDTLNTLSKLFDVTTDYLLGITNHRHHMKVDFDKHGLELTNMILEIMYKHDIITKEQKETGKLTDEQLKIAADAIDKSLQVAAIFNKDK